MVKLSKELTLGVLLVVIVIMVLKPNLLGFLYNNILGKIIFVAAVVFLSLKHTAAGLLAVVFVAIVASMSGYHGFEGMEVPADEEEDAKKKEEGFDGKKCEGEDCNMEGAENMDENKDDKKAVKDIEALLKTK
jgi:membrane protein implicated in regulation of membrane protease activity